MDYNKRAMKRTSKQANNNNNNKTSYLPVHASHTVCVDDNKISVALWWSFYQRREDDNGLMEVSIPY